MTITIDEIRGELAEIQRALLDLPADAFAEKHRLLTCQDELRALSRAGGVDPDSLRSDAELLAELAARRSQRDSSESQRINVVYQHGGGGEAGSGADGWGAMNLNRSIDAAMGVPEIEARIGHLVSILTDRGVGIPTS